MTPIVVVPDSEIAECALRSLADAAALGSARVAIWVTDGHVLLSGEVASAGDRCKATRIVGQVAGVVAVTDRLVLASCGEAADSPEMSDRVSPGFQVAARGGRVVLTGGVMSWSERELAENVVWSTIGADQTARWLVRTSRFRTKGSYP